MKYNLLFGTALVSFILTGRAYCHQNDNNFLEVISENKCTSLEEKIPGDLYAAYGQNIFYYDFSKVPFEEFSLEQTKLPKSFLENLERPRIENKKEFHNLILEEAQKLGYSKEEISKLTPKLAIKLAVKIVANKLEYRLVDSDPEFFEKYGDFGNKLPHDEIFKIGEGDCDKYAMLTVGVLNFFKEFNPSLKNIYFSDEFGVYGSIVKYSHTWTSIICVKNSEIILSQIDPTYYDTGGKLEARHGRHIPDNKERVIACFYRSQKEYDAAFLHYQKALNKEKNSDKRAEIYSELAELSYKVLDINKMEWTRKNYFDEKLTSKSDVILYYSYWVEKITENRKKAEEFKKRLFSEFPDSDWTDRLRPKKK